MRQKLFIFIALILLIGALIGLNAASYVQKEKEADNEFNPNRSSYNSGATGTRAFYDLLVESGRKVTRWQENPSGLLTTSRKRPQVFVIVGSTRREIPKEDIDPILQWVAEGGRLVIIDRMPPQELLTTTGNWKITAVPNTQGVNLINLDPSDQKSMTDKVEAAKPVQPTLIADSVNAVQPSRLASSIAFESLPAPEVSTIKTAEPKVYSSPMPKPTPVPIATPRSIYEQDAPPPTPKPTPAPVPTSRNIFDDDEPPPPVARPTPYMTAIPTPVKGIGSGRGSGIGSGEGPVVPDSTSPAQSDVQNAPVVHVANKDTNLVADFPYGSGSVTFLSDPYIVSNGGIKIVDNLQLAINLVSTKDGIIAFDEYHQGFGDSQSQLMRYFSGTPLFAILAQAVLLIGAVLYSQSRRFARPLPVVEPNRLTKLEYVSAMAELQQRTKAYDLAIENVYTDFRRRAARLFGVDNNATPRKEMAGLIAERIKADQFEVYKVMQKAEDIIHGERSNKKEVQEIVAKLREFEEKLNMKRKRKEAFRK